MENITYDFDLEKNIKLKKERNISFEDVIAMIEDGKILDIIEHHNIEKYPNQKFFVMDIDDYVYFVPFVQNKNTFFLKTIFASRKATKQYLSQKKLEVF